MATETIENNSTKGKGKKEEKKEEKMNDTMTTTSTASMASVDKDFVEYVVDRPTFKPEVFTRRDPSMPDREIYEGPIVQGYVLAHTFMGQTVDEDTGQTRDLYAYVIKLTAPSKGRDRDGQIVDVAAGQEMIVWENALLRQALPPRAMNHPQLAAHVRITFLHRAPMKNDPKKKLWNIRFDFAKEPLVQRSRVGGAANAILQLLRTAPPEPKRLVENVDPVGGGEIPF